METPFSRPKKERGRRLRSSLRLLSYQDDFYRAHISQVFPLVLWCELVGSDADFLDFYVGEEFAPDYFDDVDCSTYGFSARFNIDFLCAAVEERDASKDVIHYWLLSDQHRVVLCHG